MLEQIRPIVEQQLKLETAGHADSSEVAILAAVSGGLDSMVLLDLLHRLSLETGFRLAVAHLEHQLRPESAADAAFVALAASSRGLDYIGDAAGVEAYARQYGLSLEDAGRRLRYRFLRRAARLKSCGRVALGHHADDQAETVLMRMLRGSGTRGLGGMRAEREGLFFRPLLDLTREEIDSYASAREITYRRDASNEDVRYTRNRLRLELMPQLLRFNPQLTTTLGRTARLLQADEDYLCAAADEAEQRCVLTRGARTAVLDVGVLLSYHLAIGRRVIRSVLQALSASEGPSDFNSVEAVFDCLRSRHGIRSIRGNLRVQRGGDLLYLSRSPLAPFEVTVPVPGAVAVPQLEARIMARLFPARAFQRLRPALKGNRAAFDAERLGDSLVLRSCRPGDRIQPLGMRGHKKLSDLFIDAKIPRIARPEMPVLVSGDDIAWAVGVRSDHRFRVTDSSTEIAVLEFTSTSGPLAAAI